MSKHLQVSLAWIKKQKKEKSFKFYTSFFNQLHLVATSRHSTTRQCFPIPSSELRGITLASIVLYFPFPASKHTVHAFYSFAAVVDAFRADTLTAGVVKPSVLGRSHGLARDLALMYWHAVIKIHHSTHVFFVARVRCVDVVARHRDVLMLRLVDCF